MASRHTKKKHEHWLIGMSTSVLTQEFLTAFQNDENFDLRDWLPFISPSKPKLPTKMEVLKLCLFFRDECGKTNGWVNAGEIYVRVAEVVGKYWKMAGFSIITTCLLYTSDAADE